MRKTLFRGKIKHDNGKYKKGDWVQGNYVALIDGRTEHHHIYGAGEIIPETLGEYAGIIDGGRKDIFEGDIIVVNGDEKYLYEVIFKNGRFVLYCKRKQWIITNPEKTRVIGNIHDNPELLEGAWDNA